jgi:hypothetical protein
VLQLVANVPLLLNTVLLLQIRNLSGAPDLLLSARSLPPCHRLQALLFCWHQEASHRAWKPSTAHCPDRKESPHSSKGKNARFPTEGRKAITCYSAGSTRSPVPPRYTEAQLFTLHLFCPRTGIPAPPLSGNLLLCWC